MVFNIYVPVVITASFTDPIYASVNKAQCPVWVETFAVPPVCFPKIREAGSQSSQPGLQLQFGARPRKP